MDICVSEQMMQRGVVADWLCSRESSFYSTLRGWILSESELDRNGFPRPPLPFEPPDKAVFNRLPHPISPRPLFLPDNVPHRICVRCGHHYIVQSAVENKSDQGDQSAAPVCLYHWGHLWTRRHHRHPGVCDTDAAMESGPPGERLWSCCSKPELNLGCSTAAHHVSDAIRYSDAYGYRTTLNLPTHLSPDHLRRTKVYSLDCEMVYTERGLSLGRVTVVDAGLRTVLDTLVRPSARVLDYNTRFSGIQAPQLDEVRTTLEEVQRKLLNLISAETILVGHSLQADLKAIKLIHSRCVDTSLVFPHPRGRYRHALRSLSAHVLAQPIQEQGHDSAEDARACMSLLHAKVLASFRPTF